MNDKVIFNNIKDLISNNYNYNITMAIKKNLEVTAIKINEN